MDGTELFRRLQRVSYEKFVLHGSPHKLSILEPRQAYFREESPHANEHAIYATTYTPIAVLYALIREPQETWGWRIETDPKDFGLQVRAPAELRLGSGYLYLLPRQHFISNPDDPLGIVSRAYEPLTPRRVYEVDASVMEYMEEQHLVKFLEPWPPSPD